MQTKERRASLAKRATPWLLLAPLIGAMGIGRAGEDEVERLAKEGLARFGAGELGKAESAYLKALRLAPGEGRLHVNLAKVYGAQRDWERMRTTCQEGQKAARDRKDELQACVQRADTEMARARQKAERVQKEAQRATAKGPRAASPAPGRALREVAVPVGPEPLLVAPRGMVRLAGGRFMMGAEDGHECEKPEHWVAVNDFSIDVTEVRVADFEVCVNAGRCRPMRSVDSRFFWFTPEGGGNGEFWAEQCNLRKEGRAEHPMNCVDWNQAVTYCEFVGKRLPTEVEWEYAARGPRGRTYPWGQAVPGPKLLNACGEECMAWAKRNHVSFVSERLAYASRDRWETTAPVGQFPAGATPEGVLDVEGNVSEWVQDLETDCYDPSRCQPQSGLRVVRGAAWSSGRWMIRATAREWKTQDYRNPYIGFRCAHD